MTTRTTLVLGTRGSDLALTQSRHIARLLAERGVEARLEVIKTQGDRVQNLPFDKLEGKGFFTKEIEDALLAGSIDLAVHSLKDLPTENPAGLTVGAIPAREDVRDCLLVARASHAPGAEPLPLAPAARVGTSAVRRRAQLLSLRADIDVQELRGNVPTRVRRLAEGKYDAVLLAYAGLRRLQLDLSAFEARVMSPTILVPAPGQGALALQIRAEDRQTAAAIAPLHDAAAAECVGAERAVLARLQGGCHVPLGAHAWRDAEGMHMTVFWRGEQATVHGPSAAAVTDAACTRMGLP